MAEQRALVLAEGDAELELPDRRRPHRDRRSFDVRRTGEYIAGRGPTPCEQWATVAQKSLPDAVRWIRKRFKTLTEKDAVTLWMECNKELAGYVHPALPRLDAGQPIGGAGATLPVSHWLAATAMGARLAEQAASPSARTDLVDSRNIEGVHRDSEGGNDVDNGSDVILPPRGVD
jgi:hypothetical protein